MRSPGVVDLDSSSLPLQLASLRKPRWIGHVLLEPSVSVVPIKRGVLVHCSRRSRRQGCLFNVWWTRCFKGPWLSSPSLDVVRLAEEGGSPPTYDPIRRVCAVWVGHPSLLLKCPNHLINSNVACIILTTRRIDIGYLKIGSTFKLSERREIGYSVLFSCISCQPPEELVK